MQTAARAEEQMTGFWEYVDRGVMDASMQRFKSLDIAPTVIDFVLDRDNYVFPQRHMFETKKGLVVPEDKIAVVSLRRTQKITLGPRLVIHSLQKDSLLNSGFSIKDIDEINEAFANNEDTVASNGKAHGTASVCGSQLAWDTGIVFAKPTLVFNEGEAIDADEIDPSVTLHELVHLSQRLHRAHTDPLQLATKYELEAYVTQGESVQKDYRIPYTSSAQLAGKIYRIHERTIGASSYDITPEFLDAIRDDKQLHEMFARQ